MLTSTQGSTRISPELRSIPVELRNLLDEPIGTSTLKAAGRLLHRAVELGAFSDFCYFDFLDPFEESYYPKAKIQYAKAFRLAVSWLADHKDSLPVDSPRLDASHGSSDGQVTSEWISKNVSGVARLIERQITALELDESIAYQLRRVATALRAPAMPEGFRKLMDEERLRAARRGLEALTQRHMRVGRSGSNPDVISHLESTVNVLSRLMDGPEPNAEYYRPAADIFDQAAKALLRVTEDLSATKLDPGGWYSCSDIAARTGVPGDALEKRLQRFRKKYAANSDSWTEVEQVRHGVRYLYRASPEIMKIVADLQKA